MNQTWRWCRIVMPVISADEPCAGDDSGALTGQWAALDSPELQQDSDETGVCGAVVGEDVVPGALVGAVIG